MFCFHLIDDSVFVGWFCQIDRNLAVWGRENLSLGIASTDWPGGRSMGEFSGITIDVPTFIPALTSFGDGLFPGL